MRILVAAIGWILIDISLEITLTCNDNVKAYLIENKTKAYTDQKVKKQQDMMILCAKISAYLLSMVVCSPPYTFRNFHLNLANMYYVSGLLCINSAFFIFVLCKVRINKGQEQLKLEEAPRNKIKIIKQSIMELSLSVDSYLSGMRDTIEAPTKLQLILLMIFSSSCVSDLTDFYATAWMILHLRSTNIPYAGIYIRGTAVGSFLLAVSAGIHYWNKKRSKAQKAQETVNNSKEALSLVFSFKYLICTFFNFCVTLYAVLSDHVVGLWFVVLLQGWLKGMSEAYIEKQYGMLSRFYPQFQKCQDFTFTFGKLFILFVLPVFCWLIWGARATNWSLLVSMLLLIVMMMLQANELLKVKKENESTLQKNKTE